MVVAVVVRFLMMSSVRNHIMNGIMTVWYTWLLYVFVSSMFCLCV